MRPTGDELLDLARRILELPQEHRGDLSGEVLRALYDVKYRIDLAEIVDARTRGRNVAPTDGEIAAHRARRGAWLVTWAETEVVSSPGALRKLAARCRKWDLPMRWVPITAGGTLADWPPPEAHL